MRLVLIRDDDTNATTPVACLERLYRPLLDKGLPVNLSVIPELNTGVRKADGCLESSIWGARAGQPGVIPIGENAALLDYIRGNGYCAIQHGLSHEFVNGASEFEIPDAATAGARMDRGRQLLRDAGLPEPPAFVAPQDRFSPAALREAARRYPVISGGWYGSRHIPRTWLPKYAWRKVTRQPHWRIGRTLLLSHPGCLLSRFKDYGAMFDTVRNAVLSQQITVLVTHWWEYFPQGQPDDAFIGILHETAEFLATRGDIRVVTFRELAGA